MDYLKRMRVKALITMRMTLSRYLMGGREEKGLLRDRTRRAAAAAAVQEVVLLLLLGSFRARRSGRRVVRSCR